MEITFRGVRGSMPVPGPETLRYGGNTPCVELRTNGRALFLDAGTGLVAPVNGAPKGDSATILLTHTHWDHIQGLPFFAPLFQPGNVWHVYGPRGLDSSIDKTLAGQMQYTYFPVQLLDFGIRRGPISNPQRMLAVDDIEAAGDDDHSPRKGPAVGQLVEHQPAQDDHPDHLQVGVRR